MDNLNQDDEKYKAELAAQMNALVEACLFGDGSKHGVFVVGDSSKSTISIYALNSNHDEIRLMLMAAAEPYVFHPAGERVIN